MASGIYSYLPLGMRTLAKITRIVDEEMESVGGQKLNMPKLLPRELWEKTGRWNDMGSELVRLKDRKGEDFCLAPTHEEVITSLVASGVNSVKQLPMRLYQIGDKYRDEARPRFGLLRAREFVMKDMYSFDETKEGAMRTYEEVRGAYDRVMKRLEIPYAVAEADSGNIGGNLSHEFHALASIGEDSLLCCPSSSYHANAEKAKSTTISKCQPPTNSADIDTLEKLLEHLSHASSSLTATLFTATSSNNQSLSHATLVLTDLTYEANPFLVKGQASHLPSQYSVEALDASNIVKFMNAEKKQLILDNALTHPLVSEQGRTWIQQIQQIANSECQGLQSAHIKMAKVGDPCPCSELSSTSSSICKEGSILEEQKGIEVGHLFYLGTKYSVPLKAMLPTHTGNNPIEMGCYGIGVSRLLAVSVETSNDEKGIIWPRSIAPYRVSIIPMNNLQEKARQLYDELETIPSLSGEIVIDDRAETLKFRQRESDFIGIPYAILLGNKYSSTGEVEIVCRRDGSTSHVPTKELPNFFNKQFAEQL